MEKGKERDLSKFQASWDFSQENIIQSCKESTSNKQQFEKALMWEYLSMKEHFGLTTPYENKHLAVLKDELDPIAKLSPNIINRDLLSKMRGRIRDAVDANRVKIIMQKVERTYGDTAFFNKVEKIPKYNPDKYDPDKYDPDTMAVEEDPVYVQGGTLEMNKKRRKQYAHGIAYAQIVDKFTRGTLDLNEIVMLKPEKRKILENLDTTFGKGFLAKNLFPLVKEYCSNGVLGQKLENMELQLSTQETERTRIDDIFAEVASERLKTHSLIGARASSRRPVEAQECIMQK